MKCRVEQDELNFDIDNMRRESLFNLTPYQCVGCKEDVLPTNIAIDMDECWTKPAHLDKPVICNWCVKDEDLLAKYDVEAME